MADHYQVLGLSKSASKQEIKEAFRRLAVKFHPDKHCQSSNPAKEEATRRFKQVSEAYEVLIDDRKRAAYNLKYRAGGAAASAGFRSTNTYYNYYSESYYKPHYRASSSSTSFNVNSWVFRLDLAFRYLTSRSFLLNLTFAGILLGSTVVIDMSRETLWNMHNPGKSFAEAMEAIEKNKTQNAEKR